MDIQRDIHVEIGRAPNAKIATKAFVEVVQAHTLLDAAHDVGLLEGLGRIIHGSFQKSGALTIMQTQGSSSKTPTKKTPNE